MSRRDFLKLIPSFYTGSALGSALGLPLLQATPARADSAPSVPREQAMGGPPGARRRARIRGVCFDLFTLFDPRAVLTRARSLLPKNVDAAQFWDVWKTRQFEYSWLRAAANQYIDFERISADALSYALRATGVTLSHSAQRSLVNAYSELSPYPDTQAHLEGFKARGLKLAPLANYSPAMLARLLSHASLTRFFDDQLSTELARTFKPDPRAYALGPTRLGLAKTEIVFSAFGGWDAAGARWFGFPTFWVNRFSVPSEVLATADGTGPSLAELASFIERW